MSTRCAAGDRVVNEDCFGDRTSSKKSTEKCRKVPKNDDKDGI